jgi:hypothetical protein
VPTPVSSEEELVSGDATYTQDQHLALVATEVERATAALAAEKSALQDRIAALEADVTGKTGDVTAIQARFDVLEAEKATAEAAAETARTELASFKAELEREAEVAQLKTERMDRVKAAGVNLPEDFYTDERAQRWAQMATEDFDAHVAEITAAATAVTTAGDAGAVTVTQAARQTAAFSGDAKPATAGDDGPHRTTLAFLGARRGTATA